MKPEQIDRHLEPMQCDPDCGECCGPVMCSEPEYDRVVLYAAKVGVEPVRNGDKCPWYQDGGCSVYEARPTACRLFGHVEGMKCPRGYSAPVALTVEKRIVKNMVLEVNASGARLLHEAAYSLKEVSNGLHELGQGREWPEGEQDE